MQAAARIDHNNNFDLIRLLAACQVVYIHTLGYLKLPSGPEYHLALLFQGVPVFFVVSGFLVTDSWMRSRSVGDFFWKRSVRIYPGLAFNIVGMEFLYYLGGAILWGAGAAFFGYMAIYIATASLWLGHIVFPGLSPHYGHTFFKMPLSGVLWTLTIELSFYAVLPLILASLRWGRTVAVVAVLGLAIASFGVATQFSSQFFKDYPVLLITVPGFFWIFSIGILARLLWDKVSPLLVGKGHWWLLAYIGSEVLLQAYFNNGPIMQWKGGVSPISIFRAVMMGLAIVSLAFTARRLGRFIKHDLSYGLYLWHMTVIATLFSLGYTQSPWLWPVVFAGGLALAAISFFAVERPALRLKQKKRSDDGTALPAPLPRPSN